MDFQEKVEAITSALRFLLDDSYGIVVEVDNRMLVVTNRQFGEKYDTFVIPIEEFNFGCKVVPGDIVYISYQTECMH